MGHKVNNHLFFFFLAIFCTRIYIAIQSTITYAQEEGSGVENVIELDILRQCVKPSMAKHWPRGEGSRRPNGRRKVDSRQSVWQVDVEDKQCEEIECACSISDG